MTARKLHHGYKSQYNQAWAVGQKKKQELKADK